MLVARGGSTVVEHSATDPGIGVSKPGGKGEEIDFFPWQGFANKL
jgi:hypothetical protein